MRSRLLVAAILSAAFVGGGVLSAQPGATPSGGSPSTPTAGTPSAGAPAPTPAPAPAPTPAPTPPAPEPDLALPSEKTSNLSAQEMDQKSDELIENMEGLHRRVLELKASATKAKDVIKLNCVNEQLLVVKQLLNIADGAEDNFTEAKVQGDRNEQVHQFGQITIAAEKATQAANEAQTCIGEELHFIGKNDVTVDGPAIPHDPTIDGDVGRSSGEDPFEAPLEDPAYASPFAPQ